MMISAIADATNTIPLVTSSCLANVSYSSLDLANKISALSCDMDAIVARQEVLDSVLIWATIGLLFGLVLEFFEPLRELLAKYRAHRTDRGSREPEETLRHKWITLIGAIFVMVGIGIEIFVTRETIKFDRRYEVDDSARAELLNEANTKTDTRTRPRKMKCEQSDFANINPPKHVEIVYSDAARDGPDFVISVMQCFEKIGWPIPTSKSVSSAALGGDAKTAERYFAYDFGVTVSITHETLSDDVATILAAKQDDGASEFPRGSAPRALEDVLDRSVPDVTGMDSVDVPLHTIRIVVAPKP